MIVLKIVFEIINIVLLIHGVYFAGFAIFGLFRRPKKYPEASALRRFAVIIPARNEELVIGNLIDSIKEADYPPELIDIYVIINNCSDATEERAEEHGANAMVCKAPVKNKADVLSYAFEALGNEPGIDAYAIFDADNIVDAGFFREMNKALEAPASAAQGMRRGKNMRKTWVSATYDIYYALQNAFYNHPRNAAGMSASISGTGWVVTKDLIDRMGFDMTTIAEDFEMVNLLEAEGEHIAYCREALVFDEFVDSLKVSMIQRVRWSVGTLQCLRKFEWRLIKKALRGSLQSFDMANLNFVPIAILVSIFMPFLAYFVVDIPMRFIPYMLGLLAFTWISMSITALVAVLKSGIGLKDNLKGVIAFPLFILSWAAVMLFCFFKRDVEWTPIKHDKAVTIEEREASGYNITK